MEFVLLFITLTAAGIGAFVFIRLKVPAGVLIGALLFVAILSITTGKAYFPTQVRPVVQIFAGAIVGSRMHKADMFQLKTIILPAGLLVFGMLILNLSVGYIIHRQAGLELSTALLGSAPGGIMDMALIAEDLGADAVRVTALQFVRVVAILGILPSLLRFFHKKRSTSQSGREPVSEKLLEKKTQGFNHEPISIRRKTVVFLRTIACAAVCGLLVNMTIIPAGPLVGSMLGTIIATLLFKAAYVPQKARTLTMICAGALIGSRIGMAELLGLREIMIPAIILVVVMLASSFLFGILVHKVSKMDIQTCLLASAAGGVVEMALIADEMDADSPKVAAIHFVRFVCVIALFPSAFKFFIYLLN